MIVVFFSGSVRLLTRAGRRSQPGSDGSVVMAGTGFSALPLADAGWRVLEATVTSHLGYQRSLSICLIYLIYIKLHWYLFYVFIFCGPSSLCEVNVCGRGKW